MAADYRRTTGVALLVLLAALPVSSQSARPGSNIEARERFREFERGGIPAVVAKFGEYKDAAMFGKRLVSEDVLALVRASHAVVLGRVSSSTPQLAEDERHLYTAHTVLVQRIFKGGEAMSTGATIVVNVPGGRIDYSNGTWAEVVLTSGAPPLERGGSYLLFLELIENADVAAEKGRLGTFLIANDEGVFELKGTPPVLVPYLKSLAVAEEILALGTVDKVYERLERRVMDAPSFPGERRLKQRDP